ncbi:MAG: hypothetical protein ABFD92_18100 [Planctomycetaceae bacterium]
MKQQRVSPCHPSIIPSFHSNIPFFLGSRASFLLSLQTPMVDKLSIWMS